MAPHSRLPRRKLDTAAGNVVGQNADATSRKPNLEDLLGEADDLVRNNALLRERLVRQQREGMRKRETHAQRVAEALQKSREQVQHERDMLEGQLAEHMQRLHALEAKLMESAHHSMGMRQVESYMTRGLTNMRRRSHCKGSISQGDVFGILREVQSKIHHHAKKDDDEVQWVYGQKEQVEAEIADYRQTTAANEALERARSEVPHGAFSLHSMSYSLDSSDCCGCGDAGRLACGGYDGGEPPYDFQA
jgi:hypothetical protein